MKIFYPERDKSRANYTIESLTIFSSFPSVSHFLAILKQFVMVGGGKIQSCGGAVIL